MNVSSSLPSPTSQTGYDVTWVISNKAIYLTLLSVIFCCTMSSIDIAQHAKLYSQPRIQRATVRLILMVPIYSVLSYLSLVVFRYRFFIATLRDTYESFVLYQFLSLLVAYCGGETQLIRALEEKKYKGIHPWPLCCLPLFPLNQAFYLRCKRWVLQYALIKPVATFLSMLLHVAGVYREADFDFATNAFPWIFTINNTSISYSLWYLILFHQETKRELRYCKPMLKFVCIKSVVFFSFWQSSSIGILIAMGFLHTGDDPETREHVTSAIQDFLICVELVPIAVMHHFAFGTKKLEEEMKEEPVFETADGRKHRHTGAVANIESTLSMRDVVQDTIDTIFVRHGKLIGSEGQDGDDDDGAPYSHTSVPMTERRGPGELSPDAIVELARRGAAPGSGAGVAAYCFDDDIALCDSSSEEDDDVEEYADNEEIQGSVRFKVASAFRRVLFDVAGDSDDGEAHDANALPFCVVCGRSDREMIQRKSGLKCKECVGMKHAYQEATAAKKTRTDD